MLEWHSDVFANAGEAVAGVFDEVGAHPDLMATEALLHRATAEVSVALDERHALTFLGQQRRAAQAGRPGPNNDHVELHGITLSCCAHGLVALRRMTDCQTFGRKGLS